MGRALGCVKNEIDDRKVDGRLDDPSLGSFAALRHFYKFIKGPFGA